jgi:ferredoxin, 2Fe-2S
MVRVVFVTQEDKRMELDIPPSGTLMQAAREHNVPGIEAECGGCMACGTCHVVVSAEWYNRLPAPSGPERDILEYVAVPEPNMRLTCQIAVTEDLDGLVMRVPQH